MARSLSDAWCQNPGCENIAVIEVEISVNEPGDATRALCEVCAVAFESGRRHGEMGGELPASIQAGINDNCGGHKP